MSTARAIAPVESYKSGGQNRLTESGIVDRMNYLADVVGSKSKLAIKAGISRGGLMHIFAGTHQPSAETLMKIAAGTGCSFEWLRDGIGEPFPEKAATVAEIVARSAHRSLTDTDHVAAACAHLMEMDGLSREHRVIVCNALNRLLASRPSQRREVVRFLLAQELLAKANQDEGNTDD